VDRLSDVAVQKHNETLRLLQVCAWRGRRLMDSWLLVRLGACWIRERKIIRRRDLDSFSCLSSPCVGWLTGLCVCMGEAIRGRVRG